MRIVRGFIGMYRVFLPAIAGVIIALAGALALPAVTAAAATCPTVDSTTGAVSPAPAPGVDWSGCDLTGANLASANLADANLTGVSFGSADLGQANLQDASLADANLGTADMSQALLAGVTSGGVVPDLGVLPLGWFVKNGYIIGPGANAEHR
jgi:hypothetical protein